VFSFACGPSGLRLRQFEWSSLSISERSGRKDPLKLVIVRDIWLTVFDAPCCHTMVAHKTIAVHNVMQAITRGRLR